MTRRTDKHPANTRAARPALQARLHGLLFAGAALGTTLLTLGAAIDPKLPPFRGE